MGAHYREETFESFDGVRLFVRRWQPESASAAIGIVHGSFEHGGRYAGLAGYLSARGYAVYALDLRGHGKSPGARGAFAPFQLFSRDLGAYVRHIRASFPTQPVFLLAHSAGAAFALAYVLEQRTPGIAGIILSAPALALGTGIPLWVRRAAGVLGKALPGMRLKGLDPRCLSRDPEVVDAYRRDPLVDKGGIPAAALTSFLRLENSLLPRLAGVRLPLLILQGTDDRIVNPSGARLLRDTAGSADKTLKLYDGFFHEVLNERGKERVYDDLAGWLDARCSSRGGGR